MRVEPLIPRWRSIMRDFRNNELNIYINNVWTNREKKQGQAELNRWK